MRKAFKDIVKDELKKNDVEVLELFGREYKKEDCVYITVNDYCEYVIIRNILKPLIKKRLILKIHMNIMSALELIINCLVIIMFQNLFNDKRT